MAKREALRELQARLAERMLAVRSEVAGVSWLAVDCGGRGLLFPLAQAGEIFDVAAVLPVPHTKLWFAGVANLRGGLHAVVDLAAFLGLKAAVTPEQSRLVALNPSLGANCALRVDRLEGLRHAADLTRLPDESQPRPSFASGRWRDAAGRQWQEIALAELACNVQFLAVSR